MASRARRRYLTVIERKRFGREAQDTEWRARRRRGKSRGVERRDVIIVGSGPGGSATALALAARAPALAGRTLMLDKARHPRDKTCAGGVIPKAVRLLDALGVPFDVPAAGVDTAGVRVPGRALAVAGRDLCRVVRRREFDARLAWLARDRGVELREEERVVHLARDGAGIRVETARTTYWAPVVVGADGSGSVVRRALVPGRAGRVARAVMCDVPVGDTAWDGHARRRYDFDFAPCAARLRGYRWTFPCVIDGLPHANVGAYLLPPVDGARLKTELGGELGRVGGRARGWKAFPIHTFVPGVTVAAPHVVLVGDAAGVDPLMGEGISFALEYARLAADAILDAHARHDFAFTSYADAVHRGPLGRKLRWLERAARLFYGPTSRVWFRVGALSVRAQAIGLAWYNGVDGWDERGAYAALRAFAWGPLPRAADPVRL
jgi:flavin-dependent dehydrogenase